MVPVQTCKISQVTLAVALNRTPGIIVKLLFRVLQIHAKTPELAVISKTSATTLANAPKVNSLVTIASSTCPATNNLVKTRVFARTLIHTRVTCVIALRTTPTTTAKRSSLAARRLVKIPELA